MALRGDRFHDVFALKEKKTLFRSTCYFDLNTLKGNSV